MPLPAWGRGREGLQRLRRAHPLPGWLPTVPLDGHRWLAAWQFGAFGRGVGLSSLIYGRYTTISLGLLENKPRSKGQ